ncbi:MAG: polysaccharide deacetylase [Lachnospiraceae bacterium]|nr:polysaccharide deacetylase [Lachnospiraceae bacterium]
MEEKTNGLRDQQIRRRRINRMKMSIVAFGAVWILILTISTIVLLMKIIFLEDRMDKIAESVISVEQFVENQNQKNAGSPEGKIPDTVSDNTMPDSQEAQTDGNAAKTDHIIPEEERRKVYLTFDDGPSENTARILDILKEHNVKATFFVTGNEEETAKELYRRIVDEGHTLGMHSFTHKYDVIYQSLDAYIEDMTHLQSYLEEVTGVTTNFIRFPGGSSNHVSNVDMHELIRYVNEQGFTYFDWNVASGDATSQVYTPDELVQNVINDVVKYDTSVVLMHDSSAKGTTVEALAPMIDQLQEMGAELLPIDETTKPVQHITADNVE